MTHPLTDRRSRVRALAALTTLAVATGLVLAAPATAATASVSTIGDLETALADCTTAPNTITLGADISDGAATLTVACDTTLDLGVYDLAVRNVVIGAGTQLEVTGPTDGTEGTLTADATGVGTIAAIRTTGATLRVTGGSIHAIGGYGGAAIGGDSSGSNGTLLVEGGTVNAEQDGYAAAIGGGYGLLARGDGGVITVSGGTVTATAHGYYNTAIGGGGGGLFAGTEGEGATLTITGGLVRAIAEGGESVAVGGGVWAQEGTIGGYGGSVTIGAAGTLIASSARTAIGGGFGLPNNGAFGTVSVAGVLSLPSGALLIPDSGAGAELTVTATGSVIGDTASPATGASISGNGQIANAGVIALDPPAGMVSGNNRLVTFSTAAPSVRVFAPTAASGYRSLATAPAGTAWNTAADGTGSWFTSSSSTSGSGTTALFALVPGSLEVSDDPDDLVATAGEPFAFPVTVLGADGDPLASPPTISYTSPDCTISGAPVFETAGTCTIDASAVIAGVTVTTSFEIEVVAAPASTLTITPSASTVEQGHSLTFVVAGEDAYGNPADTSGAVLSSSVASDVISGLTVAFPHASPHTITATLGGVSESVTIEVEPAAVTTSALGGTGVDSGALVALGSAALALLLAGALALLLARRRTAWS